MAGNLVLSRFRGERIRIGDDITIEVLESHRCGKCKLRITAPETVCVWREEIYQRRQREARQAGDVAAAVAGGKDDD